MALAHAILVTLLDCLQSGYDIRKRFEGYLDCDSFCLPCEY